MVGLMGRKVGMTQIFDEGGSLIPVTAIEVSPNLVIGKRTLERDGYQAVVLAGMRVDEKKLNRPQRGQFSKDKLPAHRHVREMRDFTLDCNIGDFFDVSLFKENSYVDVSGVSRGKGFQGAMKRYGFSGGENTHGSKFHRALGSTGNAATPSRTYKGRKMAGRMGADRVTVENLRIAKVQADQSLILVVGAVPGVPGGLLVIRQSIKRG